MKYLYFILIMLCFLVPTPGLAEKPAGADDPAFQKAIEIWLSDDDASSIPKLAKLARDGNVAAQIFLSAIEFEGNLRSPWLEGLNREERHDIFRGTARFRRWLRVASKRSELAQVLTEAGDYGTMQGAIPKLYAMGEFRAIGNIISILYHAGRWDALNQLETQGVLPPEYRWTVWHWAIHAQIDGRNNNAIRGMHRIVASVRENYPELANHLQRSLDSLATMELGTPESTMPLLDMAFEDVGHFSSYTVDRLRESNSGKQIVSACRALCPSQPESCEAAAIPMNGDRPFNLNLGSPITALIPTAQYVESQRAVGEFLRTHQWYSGFFTSPEEYLRTVADKSECLANHLQAAISLK